MAGLPKCESCNLQHAPGADPLATTAACLEAQATAVYYLLTRAGETQKCETCGALVFWMTSSKGNRLAYDELARPHDAGGCNPDRPRSSVDLGALRQNLYLLLERVGDRAQCGGRYPDRGCRQTIWWFLHLATGAKAAYNEFAQNHFSDCPARETFRRKKAVKV